MNMLQFVDSKTARAIVPPPTVVNVSQVRQLSPFRYPGGKTWCVPQIRYWLASHAKPKCFVEPFAGGAIAGLTVAIENLADRVVLAEIDADIAAVWRTVLTGKPSDFEWLCSKIEGFKISRAAVERVLKAAPQSTAETAFRTILRNRVNRGGILAPGASLVKEGENGRGLASRWYAKTLVTRLRLIREARSKIEFCWEDAFGVIARHSNETDTALFIDPPYTAGGKQAGRRLYAHNLVNHDALFAMLSAVQGRFLATYDDAAEVRRLAKSFDFGVKAIPMKSTHHVVHNELLITKGSSLSE